MAIPARHLDLITARRAGARITAIVNTRDRWHGSWASARVFESHEPRVVAESWVLATKSGGFFSLLCRPPTSISLSHRAVSPCALGSPVLRCVRLSVVCWHV